MQNAVDSYDSDNALDDLGDKISEDVFKDVKKVFK